MNHLTYNIDDMKLYKYQGAGNDFLIADNRNGMIGEKDGVLYGCDERGKKWSLAIADICDRRYGVGADGLMLLEESEDLDFRMTYFNSDGSGGMMCGNGGRCIVAFAADLGIEHFDFEAADGFHTAEILSLSDKTKTIRLKMKDVEGIRRYERLAGVDYCSDGCFLDTGTRHYVRMVNGIDDYDVVAEGREIRYSSDLQPVGANVNFVEPFDGGIKVRTYEKGVEDETFACGTGIVASAIASYVNGIPYTSEQDGRVVYKVKARRDDLAVDFRTVQTDGTVSFKDVWLTGPASYVAGILLTEN